MAEAGQCNVVPLLWSGWCSLNRVTWISGVLIVLPHADMAEIWVALTGVEPIDVDRPLSLAEDHEGTGGCKRHRPRCGARPVGDRPLLPDHAVQRPRLPHGVSTRGSVRPNPRMEYFGGLRVNPAHLGIYGANVLY